MLTTGEVVSLREVANAFLPDSAVIRRPARTTDGAGGYTTADADVATVAVRVAPWGQTPMESVIAERFQAESLFRLSLPAETDVQPGDRLLVNGTMTYEVVDRLAPRGYEVVRNVAGKRVG